MRIFRFALIALPLALAGCGVPDLVAHGVKSYENSGQPAPAQPVATAQPQAPAKPADKPQPPPPAEVGPMPERTPVTVEPLK